MFKTTIHAGDVIYNPAWWTHGIRNVTDKSVAVAHRVIKGGQIGHDLMGQDEDYDINR